MSNKELAVCLFVQSFFLHTYIHPASLAWLGFLAALMLFFLYIYLFLFSSNPAKSPYIVNTKATRKSLSLREAIISPNWIILAALHSAQNNPTYLKVR